MLRKISRYDYKHLDTLANLVTNKDILEWIHSEDFNSSDFYIVILGKALKDKDFLRWFKGYGFKMNMFVLNKQQKAKGRERERERKREERKERKRGE